MYKIIGGDGREYGPVSLAQLQQWRDDGRINHQTLIQPAGSTDWKPLSTFPELGATPPPLAPAPAYQASTGLEALIPARNGMALTSYYLGVFALIPCFGVMLAIPSLILGINGLRRFRQNPAIRGKAHAWTGIILSSVVLLGHAIAAIAIFVSAKH
jgi:hypothetical protein